MGVGCLASQKVFSLAEITREDMILGNVTSIISDSSMNVIYVL